MDDSEIFSDPAKRWAWIKYQLQLANQSFTALARANNLKPQTITQVRLKPYPKIERLLASTLGLPVTTLFPERYTSSGLPLRSHPTKSVYYKNSNHSTALATEYPSIEGLGIGGS